MSKLVKKILVLAEKSGAVLYGEFVLSSGLKSDHYWDGKKVTLSAAGANLVGKVIYEMISSLKIDAVGGLEMGAIPIAAAVAVVSHLEGHDIPAFIVRKSAKEHGTKKVVEGYLNDGDNVVIVEDVVTTGESVFKAIEAVQARGCKVVKIIALVDRHEGGSDRLRGQGYDFESILDFQKKDGRVVLVESTAVRDTPLNTSSAHSSDTN
jgi:orotate phosphoribosyltransferase